MKKYLILSFGFTELKWPHICYNSSNFIFTRLSLLYNKLLYGIFFICVKAIRMKIANTLYNLLLVYSCNAKYLFNLALIICAFITCQHSSIITHKIVSSDCFDSLHFRPGTLNLKRWVVSGTHALRVLSSIQVLNERAVLRYGRQKGR